MTAARISETKKAILEVQQVAHPDFKRRVPAKPFLGAYWLSRPPLVSVVVVVVDEVDVSVTVEVSGTVEVVVVVVGVVVEEVEVLVGVVVVLVVDVVVEELVVLDEDVSLPLSSPETTASAIPRPSTAATRIAISAFMPPLIPSFGGSPGG
jgi:hypothetical protein